MTVRTWLAAACVGVVLVVAGAARADDEIPSDSPLNVLGSGTTDELAGRLRGLLVKYAPETLFEHSYDWGKTRLVADGVEWKGRLGLKPQVQYKDKNDGVWRKLAVTADDLPNTLILDIRHVRNPEDGKVTFDTFVAFDAKVHYEQQNWESGVKLYAGSARFRVRVQALVKVEVTTRVEPNGTIFPDTVFRMRATHADVRFDNFTAEHVAGLGGEGAKLLGDAARGLVHDLKPTLEHDLLTKGDAAIVKAADTKEIRLSLAGLFKGKAADPAANILEKARPKK
jgi:hypothetical protein